MTSSHKCQSFPLVSTLRNNSRMQAVVKVFVMAHAIIMDIWATVYYLLHIFYHDVALILIEFWTHYTLLLRGEGQVWLKPRLLLYSRRSTPLSSSAVRVTENKLIFQPIFSSSIILFHHPFPAKGKDLLKLTGSRRIDLLLFTESPIHCQLDDVVYKLVKL